MRIWLAVIKRICSKDNTLSAFMGHKEKGLLNLNLKEKKVTAVASHGKNHNSKIVHKGSATRHSCVDFFFFFFLPELDQTPLYFMMCAAFVFILVSGSFTWHLKFLNPLVISLIHEDNSNLHPASTFLV